MQHLSKSAIILLLVLTAAVPCTERTVLWSSPYHRFYKAKEKAKPTLAPQDAYFRRPWQGGTCSLATVCEDYALGKQVLSILAGLKGDSYRSACLNLQSY